MSSTLLVPVYFGAIEAGRLWRSAKRDGGVIFIDSIAQDSRPFPKAWIFLPHRRGFGASPGSTDTPVRRPSPPLASAAQDRASPISCARGPRMMSSRLASIT
jgi:hypothetical protein